mgnify:CR=1 FL=1
MSGKVFFIGCTHFGHENMAKKRGFDSSEQHDELIISNWNKVVDKGDVTYLCGDVTMESKKFYPLLNELKGMKKVILGNHCMMNNVPELLKYVNGVAGIMKYKSKEYGSFWLTHCPVHPSELDYRVGMNIHAHVHENSIDDKRYINVCCENVDYTPRTLAELMAASKKDLSTQGFLFQVDRLPVSKMSDPADGRINVTH